MRIAMISEHASPLATIGGVDAGGQNVHVAALATALAQRGHEVVVYTRRDRPDLPERAVLADGVTVEHLPGGPSAPVAKDDLPPYLPQMATELIARLPAFEPDLLHGHFWMSGRVGESAGGTLGLPLVQTFHALGVVKRRHQGAADTSPAERIAVERRLACTATRLTASCTDELRELLAMGAARRRVDVVPCGVDVDRFAPGGDGPVPGRILCVGRLVPRKGVDDVIRALRYLPGAHVVVAGGPPADRLHHDAEAQRLVALARDEGVGDRVRLVGKVDHTELAAHIRGAEAVACVPHYEPFGIVPLEAMACGVPVVGSAVGGLLDTVLDGVTGFLVRPRSPQSVADALRAILGNAELRGRLGAAGRRRALSYTWADVAAATERVYVRAALVGRRADAEPSREVVG